MFTKVLVANRGPIACRIMRSLDELGIASVGVFAADDAYSLHVERASESIELGEGRVAETYLDVDKILAAAHATGARAIHPGYGFLSENADFAERCEAEGIVFIGPTPEQIRLFGEKHTAREIAQRAGVPLLPGSGLLADLEAALEAAEEIGYPLMLKSTAGGGGIGMARCKDRESLIGAFDRVRRLADSNFGNSSVFVERFVERARHVEVQIFGDGRGKVVSLGERDCSMQRRHQKMIEESPAPGVHESTRKALHRAAVHLAESISYRSAGTVEFLYDAEREEFFFLEVNTRLQVEHGVTEAVTGIDLVAWMIELGAGCSVDFGPAALPPNGWSIQARLYAESPIKDFAPSSGLITDFSLPGSPRPGRVRCDHALTGGLEISPLYDPMLAKIIAHGRDRAEALLHLERALAETRVHGIDTNRDFLLQVIREPAFRRGDVDTSLVEGLRVQAHVIEVIDPGLESTIQDWPGRLGFWHVGIPPSGPMDFVAHRIANRLVGNPEGSAALEIAAAGPTLRFHSDVRIAICGADMQPVIDGDPVPMWAAIDVRAGQILGMSNLVGRGQRTTLAVAGAFDVPKYLGSRATFILGGFGGHGGRPLRHGDVLPLGRALDPRESLSPRDEHLEHPARPVVAERPVYAVQSGEQSDWEIDVTYGPHAAPEFFTEASIRTFFEATWEVHYNSSRTGVRLIGPNPEWARADGGEAGLHPSNIHDNAYAIGSIDFTGDMPVILGLDGPSLGGFVCPASVIQADLWKIGQLAAGDRLRFRPVTLDAARRREREIQEQIRNCSAIEPSRIPTDRLDPCESHPILRRSSIDGGRVAMAIRRAGDRALLVEFGEMVLDLALRLRIHGLMTALEVDPQPGVVDLTPGIRSLQVHYDSLQVGEARLIEWLLRACEDLPSFEQMTVSTRTVHLPLAWDDSQTRLATERYMQSVRSDAPWCPDNIDFIRRINGLEDREQVKEIVYNASYLVMGLGDVYLGAPVATPIDPRQRLITTKYNPARTWTPENAVGIGGAYLCIYGMEGPGGYQFVGRTLQMWNRFRETEYFKPGKPWLLRFFDQIRFYPVSEEELLVIRRDFPRGAYPLRIDAAEFKASDYAALLAREASEIEAVRALRHLAFARERERWQAAGVAEHPPESESPTGSAGDFRVPPGSIPYQAHIAGSVWDIPVAVGDHVVAGDDLVVLEAMKTEFRVVAECDGEVVSIGCRLGQIIRPGQILIAIQPLGRVVERVPQV